MIEIGTDVDERVYARWAPGGPWTVLDRDGGVAAEPHAMSATPWRIDDETPQEVGESFQAGYNEGYDAGLEDGSAKKPVATTSDAS